MFADVMTPIGGQRRIYQRKRSIYRVQRPLNHQYHQFSDFGRTAISIKGVVGAGRKIVKAAIRGARRTVTNPGKLMKRLGSSEQWRKGIMQTVSLGKARQRTENYKAETKREQRRMAAERDATVAKMKENGVDQRTIDAYIKQQNLISTKYKKHRGKKLTDKRKDMQKRVKIGAAVAAAIAATVVMGPAAWSWVAAHGGTIMTVGKTAMAVAPMAQQMLASQGVPPETNLQLDPVTGYPINPNTGKPFDPNTGQPVYLDPNTGQVMTGTLEENTQKITDIIAGKLPELIPGVPTAPLLLGLGGLVLLKIIF